MSPAPSIPPDDGPSSYRSDPREYCETCPNQRQCNLLRFSERPCRQQEKVEAAQEHENQIFVGRGTIPARSVDEQMRDAVAAGAIDPDPRGTQAPWQRPRDPVLLPGLPDPASLMASAVRYVGQSGAMSSGQLLRYDLIPWHIFADRLAKRYTDGAARYGEYNWQKGLTDREYVLDRVNHFLDHAHRAVERIRSGMQVKVTTSSTETLSLNHAIDQKTGVDDDLAAAMWGIIFLMAAQRGKADL